MNSTYSITVNAGVTSIAHIPSYLSEGTALTTVLYDGTTLPTVVHNGDIQITVAASLAIAANDGMRFSLRQDDREITRGNIFVRSTSTPSTGSGSGDSGPVEWVNILNKPTAFNPTSHQHNVNDLNNAGVVGKAVLTATDATSARAALGAGTSSLVIGSGAQNAKAGNYVPAWSEISAKPSAFNPTVHTHAATDISDASAQGVSILTAIDGATVRSLIGAGTSNLALGTTAGTAKAGNYVPAWTEVTGKPATFPATAHTHVSTEISDATDVGRGLFTATTAAAARGILGISDTGGGSSTSVAWADITGKPTTFAPIIGNTATTAKAGNYAPDWTELTNVPVTFAPSAHTHASTDLSDSTTTGRNILTAASGAAVRSLIGAGTSNLAIGTTGTTAKAGDYVPSWNEVTSKPATFAPSAHTHTSADVTDATAIGKTILTSATSADVRSAIGAGTSNLAIGTTANDAKAGNYVPDWSEVVNKPTTFTPSAHTHLVADLSNATAIGKNVLTAADGAAIRTLIGAGTGSSNLTLGTTSTTAKAGDYAPAWTDVTAKPATFTPSAHSHPSTDISDASTVGKGVLTAVNAAAARSAIGAGTSNVVVGTGAADAKAGNYVPDWAEISNKPATFAPSAHTHAVADVTGLQTTLDGKVDKSANLSDLQSATIARNNLGLGSAAVSAASAFATAAQGAKADTAVQPADLVQETTIRVDSTSTHSVDNSTTLVNHPQLVTATLAAGLYFVRGRVLVSATTTADATVYLATPTNAVGNVVFDGLAANSTNTLGGRRLETWTGGSSDVASSKFTFAGLSDSAVGVNKASPVYIEGLVQIPAGGGTLSIQYAQSTATASAPVSLLPYSFLTVRKIGS